MEPPEPDNVIRLPQPREPPPLEPFMLRPRTRLLQVVLLYPAGACLILSGALLPWFIATEDEVLLSLACMACGFFVTWLAWTALRRMFVHVDADGVILVNRTSTYVVPWSELREIDFHEVLNQGGGTAYHQLLFITADREIVAESIGGSARRNGPLAKARERIYAHRAEWVRAGSRSTGEGVQVSGARAVWERLGDWVQGLGQGDDP